MNAKVHAAVQRAANATKGMGEPYAEQAVKNVLFELSAAPVDTLVADLDDVRAWVEKNVREAWKVKVFDDAFASLGEAARLEATATATQPEDFTALGAHWFAAYERAHALTGSGRHEDTKVSFEAQLLLRRPSRVRLAAIVGLMDGMSASIRASDQYAPENYAFEYAHKNVLGALIEAELPLPAEIELAVLEWAGGFREMQVFHQQFFPALVKVIESRLGRGEAIPVSTVAMLRRSNIVYEGIKDSPVPELLLRLRVQNGVNPGEAWADALLRDLETIAQRDAWQELLEHARSPASKPNAAWEKKARGLIQRIGADAVAKHLLAWLPLIGAARTQPLHAAPFARGDANQLFDQFNTRVARGLVWFAALLPASDHAARTFAGITLTSLKKVAGVGPRDPMLANAGVFALGRMNTLFAVGQLARLKTKVTFKTTLKEIEKALEAAATQQGVSKADLEELSIPTMGLEEVGKADFEFGEARAELRVVNSIVSLQWFDAKGKTLKNPPSSLKKDFADELKELKSVVKDVEGMLAAQSIRLERLVLARKPWTLEDWKQRYLDHALVGCVARRLVWTFSYSGDVQNGIWADGQIVDSSGQPVELHADATVTLWHPLDSSAERVLDWRTLLETCGIVQPWKQAHREIYLLTAAEERTDVYSNRFAAHILKQHQFNQLAALRGWRHKLRLMVDDSYPPATLELPQWNLRAEFWVEGAGDGYGTDTNETGTYFYLSTDQVRFYPLNAPENHAHAGSGQYEQWVNQDSIPTPPLRLETIPKLVLSEVLRDVDLFVGVASVGNDPTWNDGGPQGRYREYWQHYSFGDLTETAQSRKALLETLVPRLKIKDVTRVEGKFLHVKGTRHEYKIHLGSGNILMLPNDQYLCIVPGQSVQTAATDIKLPFEGDRTLAVILSKAFMLADDKNIKDPTITRQL